jgi:hypothetical protein
VLLIKRSPRFILESLPNQNLDSFAKTWTTKKMAKTLDLMISETWAKAQSHWSQFLLLSDPKDNSQQHSIAQIHLGTRQVTLNHDTIKEKKLEDCIEALLAHEIGHHVRYPGTLTTQARLHLLEKSLIPIEEYSLINLFTDIMINERIGRTLHEQLIRIYQAFDYYKSSTNDPAFIFYLAIYEELWQTEPGILMGAAQNNFEETYPTYRADAQLLSQNLFNLGPNIYTQFLYFISVVCRYIKPPKLEKPENTNPYQCAGDEPTPEDWADALTPSAREKEAIRRALHEGWINQKEADRLDKESLERRIMGLPGVQNDTAGKVPEIMAAYYRQQADRYLVHPPPQRTLGEAVVPTSIDDWEPQDSVQDIDWLSTLLYRGDKLGIALPLKRNRIAEVEGYEVPLWLPKVEIYLDVSGSMPDPRYTRNAMTLAAQILVTGTIRADGRARALLYSSDYVTYWQWCRSEIELSRFLMHYIGAGTVFPFKKLQESVMECGDKQPIRVVISDNDFDRNYDEYKQAADILDDAILSSQQFILLLHSLGELKDARYKKAGATVIRIEEMEDFPKLAAKLAHALFSENAHEHP